MQLIGRKFLYAQNVTTKGREHHLSCFREDSKMDLYTTPSHVLPQQIHRKFSYNSITGLYIGLHRISLWFSHNILCCTVQVETLPSRGKGILGSAHLQFLIRMFWKQLFMHPCKRRIFGHAVHNRRGKTYAILLPQ